MLACGLDFGTSNSTAGLPAGNGVRLVPLEDGAPTLPTALFFDFDSDRELFGRAAMSAYIEGWDGRLVRSIKSLLGSSLIHEDTLLKRRRIPFRDVIALVIRHIKAALDRDAGRPVEAVVHGRPVHFVDGDEEADRQAQNDLEAIARRSGFSEVSFQFEPIAAALHYEQQIAGEEIALIADIGGGTSDFSVVRLGPRRAGRAERGDDILSNDGCRIGGTDFDRLLSLDAVMPLLGYQAPMQRRGLIAPQHYFHDLATWAKINFLYNAKTLREVSEMEDEAVEPRLFARLGTVLREQLGHQLAIDVEAAKVELSHADRHRLDLSRIEPGLAAPATRAGLDRAIAEQTARLAGMVRACLAEAGIAGDRIDAVFLTGGSTLLPAVRQAIVGAVPAARVVEGDKFGAVGLGLTLEAQRRYG
jgi:hypothetical chaperone protein